MKHLVDIVPGDPIPFTTPPPPPPPPRSESESTTNGDGDDDEGEKKKAERAGAPSIHWFNSARKGYSKEKVVWSRSTSRGKSKGSRVSSQTSFDSTTAKTTRTLHCPLPQWFSFVLTEANGDYTYGVSLTFYEPATIVVVPPKSLYDGVDYRLGGDGSRSAEVAAATALSGGVGGWSFERARGSAII